MFRGTAAYYDEISAYDGNENTSGTERENVCLVKLRDEIYNLKFIDGRLGESKVNSMNRDGILRPSFLI